MSDDVVQWPLFDPSANCVSQVIFWKTMEIKLLSPVPHPKNLQNLLELRVYPCNQTVFVFVIIAWKIRKI